jgi:hypothetical protein
MLLIKKLYQELLQADFEGFLHGYNLRMRLSDRMSKILESRKEIENELSRKKCS